MKKETLNYLMKRHHIRYRKIYATTPRNKQVAGFLTNYGLDYYCIRYDGKKSFKIKDLNSIKLRIDNLDADKKFLYSEESKIRNL